MQDPHGKVPLYWGIAADGALTFSDDAKLLKQGCGKSFAPFPQGKCCPLCIINLDGHLGSFVSKALVNSCLVEENGWCGIGIF